MNLENHIDEPIKKAVVGMALLGFEPAMSCCGFTYQNEGVPKTHLLNKPYIYILQSSLNEGRAELLMRLASRAVWVIEFLHNDFVDFWGRAWKDGHPWSGADCPHQHETNVFAIDRLEKAIAHFRENFKPRCEIRDGNSIYTEKYKLKHWQYKPTESWLVTPETFDAL